MIFSSCGPLNFRDNWCDSWKVDQSGSSQASSVPWVSQLERMVFSHMADQLGFIMMYHDIYIYNYIYIYLHIYIYIMIHRDSSLFIHSLVPFQSVANAHTFAATHGCSKRWEKQSRLIGDHAQSHCQAHHALNCADGCHSRRVEGTTAV